MNIKRFEPSGIDKQYGKTHHLSYHNPDYSFYAHLHIYTGGEVSYWFGNAEHGKRYFNVKPKDAILRFTRLCYLIEKRFYRAQVNVF